MLHSRQSNGNTSRSRDPHFHRPRLERLEDRLLLAVYVVNTTDDLPDLTALGDGKVDVDIYTPGDQVTLRGALMDAYYVSDKNTIEFNIPGPGPHVIQPTVPLPETRYPVTINGYSQPGAVSTSKTVRQGNDAVIQIELDGSYLPMGADGLVIEGGQSEVKGLAIHSVRGKPIPSYDDLGVVVDAEGGNAIRLANLGGNIIAGNFLGATAGGVPRGNFGGGVSIASANNVLQENIIVGNLAGVAIDGVEAKGNKLFANYIGVEQDGKTPAHNDQGVLIARGASQNEIGGTNENFGNVISANQRPGVSIYGLAPGNTVVGANVVQNNLIGTDKTGKIIDPDGTPKSGDELGNWDFGISITASQDNYISQNVISGNRQSGVVISDPRSHANTVTENWIGTDLEGDQSAGKRVARCRDPERARQLREQQHNFRQRDERRRHLWIHRLRQSAQEQPDRHGPDRQRENPQQASRCADCQGTEQRRYGESHFRQRAGGCAPVRQRGNGKRGIRQPHR